LKTLSNWGEGKRTSGFYHNPTPIKEKKKRADDHYYFGRRYQKEKNSRLGVGAARGGGEGRGGPLSESRPLWQGKKKRGEKNVKSAAKSFGGGGGGGKKGAEVLGGNDWGSFD